MTWLDLALFTGAVYGLAWLVTRSSILRRPREALAEVPCAGELVRCIVCTGAWAAVAVLFLLPSATLFGGRLGVRSVADGVLLVAWAVFATWAIARGLGDAD